MYRIHFDQIKPPSFSPYFFSFPLPLSLPCFMWFKTKQQQQKPQSPLSVHECRTIYCRMGDISGVVTLKKTSPEVVTYEQVLSKWWNMTSPLPDSCWGAWLVWPCADLLLAVTATVTSYCLWPRMSSKYFTAEALFFWLLKIFPPPLFQDDLWTLIQLQHLEPNSSQAHILCMLTTCGSLYYCPIQ